ncbi:Putative small multi-drug export protein [Gracilibacillus ureilyticus]|uniref:Putative small multi-drug export protein n=1 Tax=Gracilibacillus ureilyticus TaxID=531814 RepID=A0A1H9USS0_9BACI|nr:small multi-drug export protein [Gracilibacillus ureilyticus]SES12174.1 Putative small multi-drug export protein [Gracilibacillus ureilyticus]
MEYLLVFIGAAIPWLEIALVIPLGIIRGLQPIVVIILAFIGNMFTIIPLIIGYDKFKQWLNKRQEQKSSKRTERAKSLWNKYGLPGMILLGPILIGSHIAAFIGMTLGATKKATLVWSTVSIGGWSLIFGLLTALGIDIFVPNE